MAEPVQKSITEQQPVDIVRWPNLEHRFTSDSPLQVGLTKPVNVGFTEAPLRVGLTEPANVNMNIITPNAVGVNLLGSKEPVALRFVIGEPIIAKSDYTIAMKINGAEVFSISVAGTTVISQTGIKEG
jgi:hypothetical protein